MKLTIAININKPNKIQPFFLDSFKEYEKRLSKYTKASLLYYKNSNDLNKLINPKTKVIKLTMGDKTIDSVSFSHKIKKLEVDSNSVSNVVVIISYDDLIYFDNVEIDNFCITSVNTSLEMQTLLLLEQIYRAYKINNNESYHK